MKAKKKITIIVLILILLGGLGIVYLNNVLLPTKIKSLLINSLQQATQQQVSLGSLRFNIFKGLVLRDLVIGDKEKAIVNVKEASCLFLVLPIFKKIVVIPSIKLSSPEIFLKRNKDGTLNIQDFFMPKMQQNEKPQFGLVIYRIAITDAKIRFQDESLAQPFSKEVENLDLELRFSLPDSIRFRLSANIQSALVPNLKAAGEFKLAARQLIAKVALQDIAPKEFSGYYQGLGIDISQGLVSALVDLKFQNDTLGLGLAAQSKNIAIAKERIKANLTLDIKAQMSYNLKDLNLAISGQAGISDSNIDGLEFASAIKNINGRLSFDNSGLSSEKLTASVLGLPVEAKLTLVNFKAPLFNINLNSSLRLDSLPAILKDKFNFVFPGALEGSANLFLTIENRPADKETLKIAGYLDFLGAAVKLEKVKRAFEDIQGRLEFSSDQLKWSGLTFRYLDGSYKTSGKLTDFKSPQVELGLTSEKFYLDSSFSINNKQIKLEKAAGKYYNSEFALGGNINTQEAPLIYADIEGNLKLDLEDAPRLLEKFKNQIEQARLEGRVDAQFNLKGNLNDIKNCAIQANLTGVYIRAYGLKAEDLRLDYAQAGGVSRILAARAFFYGGSLELNAEADLKPADFVYGINLNLKDVKIGELKEDTAAKKQDLAGNIQAALTLQAQGNDISKLNGRGNIFIGDGKLWELNLFKGLGSLIFVKDFSSIVFHEASCDFTIQDKSVSSANLSLKSSITELSGALRIGFDSSIEASLNVKILDEAVPLSGTFKDITSLIAGGAGQFGLIRISGTLKEPKYKFQPAVVNIIKGITDIFFSK